MTRPRGVRRTTPRFEGVSIIGLGWQKASECSKPYVDPDIFFSPRGTTDLRAKTICQRCPVAAACLDYAIVNREEHGVWGGTTEEERRLLTASSEAPLPRRHKHGLVGAQSA